MTKLVPDQAMADLPTPALAPALPSDAGRAGRAGRAARCPRAATPSALWLTASLAAAAACGGTGMGADTRADVTAQMTTAQQPIEGCYQSALKANRKLAGVIVLAFVAAPDTGQFQDVTVTRDDLGDPAVRSCVVDAVGKLKLARPQAARVAISYPIRFSPRN
jgi:hypothetical protein